MSAAIRRMARTPPGRAATMCCPLEASSLRMTFRMIRRSLAAALLGLAAPLAGAMEPKAAQGWQPPLAEIETLLRAQIFDPAQLDSPAYAELRSDLRALAATAPARDAFIEAFNQRWLRGPSSHVRLQSAPVNAAQLAAQLDSMNAGAQAVQLRWEGETAVLAVHTMMGRDTEQAITEAYRAIVARPARAVVIDLRQNTGGAFAVRPLVGHLLARPVDSGVFLSRRWPVGGSPEPGGGEHRRAVGCLVAAALLGRCAGAGVHEGALHADGAAFRRAGDRADQRANSQRRGARHRCAVGRRPGPGAGRAQRRPHAVSGAL